ncbi:alpha/beta hydrolase [Chitinimonas taiwanensis]|uniref:alpha/beta hydrolase n=1 Tax=Chitinimonas taiwanensis TaxID=240412 RepID=UPI0035AF8EF7
MLKIMVFLMLPTLLLISRAEAQDLASHGVPAYLLKGTEVVPTPSLRLGRDYEAFVSLPADYAQSTRRYPVLYVTDADYAFPLIRAIANRVDRHGVGLQDFILIGLSYAKGENGALSRNRDYTPGGAGVRPSPEQASGEYGQAAAYLQFLREEALPVLERRYRIDPSRRIFVGHSYGALLGLHVLFTQPSLFSHYILGSPSLWFDQHQTFAAERRYAAQHKTLAARVRVFIGAEETVKLGRGRDMVGDLARFSAQIRQRNYRGLDWASSVLPGEDHATVFPLLITRGLMWALPEAR